MLTTSEYILLIVSGFGLLQGVFSALLLYFHHGSDRTVNRFLALYITALTLPVSVPLVQHFFSWQIIAFIEPFLTLIPVFLYLYVRSFKEVITWRKAWPHFILFFICAGIACWIYVDVGSKYPMTEKIPDEIKKNFLVLLPFNIRLVQRITYYILSIRALAFYQRSILHLFSDTSRINLNWIKWLINGFLFLIIMSIVTYFLMLRFAEHFDLWVLLAAAIVSLYILMAVFKGMTQVSLWQVHADMNKEELEEEINNAGQIELLKKEDEKASLSKSRPGDTKIREIAGKILTIMENEKLYQEPELTLQNLADKLQFPSYQVSQAINEGMKKSFYDLVNGYRVEEAKRLLLDPVNKNYTILSVGFEAGFNSKTTFNTVFKKFTGYTPTEFKEVRKSESPLRAK